jgi:hypothetical protein
MDTLFKYPESFETRFIIQTLPKLTFNEEWGEVAN